MCINWLKNLIQALKPEEISVPETADTGESVTIVTVTGEFEEEPEPEQPITTPIIVSMKKPYEGINFHVLLDNGHASSTPGKRQQLENGKYFYEWEFNRDIVRRIALRLDDLGIPYEILVPERDKDVSLSDRAARANSCCSKYGKENCFFISVHSNAYGDGVNFSSAKGWSVWTTKGNTSSDKYATILFDEAEKILPRYKMTTRKDMSDGDPDYEENFTVIYKTWCPAVLTENLFFTNKEEVAWLMTDEGRDVIAQIHVDAIKKIIESRK